MKQPRKGRLFGKPQKDDLLIVCVVCEDCYNENPETITFTGEGFRCPHIYAYYFSDGEINFPKTKIIGGYRAYPYSLKDLGVI